MALGQLTANLVEQLVQRFLMGKPSPLLAEGEGSHYSGFRRTDSSSSTLEKGHSSKRKTLHKTSQ